MLTQDPIFEDVLAALDAFAEPLAVEGTIPDNGLTLVLPSGERSPAIGPLLAPWILQHGEPAPFGDGRETRLDPEVRRAHRLRDRGAVRVEGFDPASILPTVEEALSADEHLEARLTDVLLYEAGDHFKAHRDTPRAGSMVGTLVVSLPLAHRGGALRLESGTRTATFLDGRRARAGALAWVAFHGDIDHEVTPVEEGQRVTLTYALHRRGEPRRADEAAAARLRDAVQRLLRDPAFMPEGGTWLLPCARPVIRPSGAKALSIENLVGRDREIAAVLRSVGLAPQVRPCVVFVPADRKEAEMTPLLAWAYVAIRLDRPSLPPLEETITLARRARDDDGPMEAQSLHAVEARGADRCQCLIRGAAHATLIHEALFSDTGYFGNDHFDAWLYEFAAVEVEVSDLRARGLFVEPPKPRVRHAKFGEGEVLSETPGESGMILEVKFADGSVRKLLAKFLQRLES